MAQHARVIWTTTRDLVRPLNLDSCWAVNATVSAVANTVTTQVHSPAKPR